MTTKIYIVSLSRAQDRREFMVDQLAGLRLPYTFVDAIDAARFSDAQIDEINAARTYHKVLKRGEIACAMSHAKALAEFLDDPSADHALIMEDDVMLGRQLPAVLQALEQRPSPDSATLLYSPIYRKVVLASLGALSDGYEHVSPDANTNVFGTQAYFVTKPAAARLREGFAPVRSIADDWNRYVELGLLRAVNLVYPFPVLHAEFLSVINPATGKLGIRTRLKNYLYYNRVFPFYQLFLVNRRRTAEVRQKQNIVFPGKVHGKTYRL